MFLKCVLAYLIRLIREPHKAQSVSAWVPDLLSNACLCHKDTVQWGARKKKRRNAKVKMRGAVLGAALRNHCTNAVRTLLQGKCFVSHLCTGIREKMSSVRRERIMQDKAGLSFPREDFLPQTEKGTETPTSSRVPKLWACIFAPLTRDNYPLCLPRRKKNVPFEAFA